MEAVRSLGPPAEPAVGREDPSQAAVAQVVTSAVALALANQKALVGLGIALGAGLVFSRMRDRAPAFPAPRNRTLSVRHMVEVAAPVSRVFAFWSSFRNLPRVFDHLLEVTEGEHGISHWIAESPDGERLEWDVEVTALKAHRRIAWKSLGGGDVHMSGEARFEETAEDGTRVCVSLSCQLPGPERAGWIEPQQQLEADLERFRTLMEPVPA
jgi:uncharacterized membrane protein